MANEGVRFDQEEGFTLLELIVVLSIAAMTATLVLPRVQSTASRTGLQATAQKLASALRLAHAEGLRQGIDQNVILDLQGRAFWSDAAPRHQSIDPAIQIAINDDGFEWAGQERKIRFPAEGGATGGEIVLADGRNEARIAVDWLTGVTTLKSGR